MLADIKQFEGCTCTINTTEDCNLRCKYCYETNKQATSITMDKCQKFIDLILSDVNADKDPFKFKGTDKEWFYEGLVLDFIGGDSLINPSLLDKILLYFNTHFATVSDKYTRGWRASISSNGTFFTRKDVRDFCEKWKDVLSVGVSIDGCPELHDKNRVFPNGKGSFEEIMRGWEWYRKTFPIDSLGTKATWSKDAIPYIYESLKFLHEDLGLKYIRANFIMEDSGASEEDFKELDKQLEKCCEYLLDHRDEVYFLPFDKTRFVRKYQAPKDFQSDSWCGSGCMPCLSISGDIYPCFRWLPASQNGREGVMKVGNVVDGFSKKENFQKVLENSVRAKCTKDPKCLECEYEPGCSYCIAGCYAEYNDFIRTTHICEYTKLQFKWAEKYWEEYEKSRNS